MRFARLFCSVMTILTVFSSWFISSVRGENAREIAKKAFPSVLMLVMQDSAGQPLSLGSGFFVKEGVVATNLHVIAGAVKGYAKIVGQKTKYEIAGFVAMDEQRDLVFLKIKFPQTLTDEEMNVFLKESESRSPFAPALSLGDSTKVSVGDEIFVVGNPQGLEGTFSKGIVSAIRTVGEDSLLQITAPISPGSSGGPVLNEEGKVIGVAVATFKGGQNLNFAIPASYLFTLLGDTKSLRPLEGEKAAENKSKSILSDLGGRSTEGVVGRLLIWGDPFFQFGNYSFTIQNNLDESVVGIFCLVIFYDGDNRPIDTDIIKYSGIIPPKLAKRVNSKVHESVQILTTHKNQEKPHTKVEFRILDFQIVESSEGDL